jgi:hypothetical protein
VRLLDHLRLDSRLQVAMPVPDPQPLRAREVLERVPRRQRLVAPLGGAVALALAAALGLLLPEPPRPAPSPSPAPAASPAAEAEPATTP